MSQEEINESVNRPILVAYLDNWEYKDQPDTYHQDPALPYEELSQYHTDMVFKRNVIRDIIILEEFEDTKETWDLLGAKTFQECLDQLDALRNPPEE